MKRFLPAAALATAVTITSPFVGLIRNALFDAFPRGAVKGLALGLGLLAVVLFAYALARIRRRRLLRYGALVTVGFLLWVQAVGFKTGLASVNVVEKIHIVEYGLLAFLLYRALRPRGDLGVVLLPLLWVTLAGTLEEGMQWWVETRTGEIRDIVLNAFSGVCGLVFAFALEPPEGLSWRLSLRGWRSVGDTAALVTLFLGGFFWFAHLGTVVEDPDIGRFRSYFTREELVEASARRTEMWATDPPGELSPWVREDRYLTEAGWHNQHRNQSYEQGLYAWARQTNRILETYYRPYLDLESFRKTGNRRWYPATLEDVERRAPAVDPRVYFSPVGAKRIYTRPSKPLFLAMVLAVALGFWGLPRVVAGRG